VKTPTKLAQNTTCFVFSIRARETSIICHATQVGSQTLKARGSSFVLFSMQSHLHHCHCSSSSSLLLHCITMAESTYLLLFLLSLFLIMPNGAHSYDNNTFYLQKSQKKHQNRAPGCLLPQSSEFCSKNQPTTPTLLSYLFTFIRTFFLLLRI